MLSSLSVSALHLEKPFYRNWYGYHLTLFHLHIFHSNYACKLLTCGGQ